MFDYRVWALCGDGDMMEGVSNEAASLAGHLRLSNLVWIYDSNRITIEGITDLAFSDDVGRRFAAYGWDVQHVADANDTAAFEAALAGLAADRPTLIIVRSVIGYGAPHKQGTREAHGEPLGEDEVRLRQAVLWLAGRRAVPGAGRGARAFRRQTGPARRGPLRRLDRSAATLP